MKTSIIAPDAPKTQTLSAGRMSTSFTSASLKCESRWGEEALPLLPPRSTEKSSGGAPTERSTYTMWRLSGATAKESIERSVRSLRIDPVSMESWKIGLSPSRGAVKKIDFESEAHWKSCTQFVKDSVRSREVAVARS